jgi:serine/threonine-protein kinase
MSLAPGTRLGRYQIESLIGAGGMGEVYKARDNRLGRHVAIKVLAPRLAEDPDVRRRFEREARAAAQLSHPNIVAIFDVGEEAETAYAVMELLEGETLRASMQARSLPLEVTRAYALHIVNALTAAHAKGIVHRDLKPENVFLAIDGAVKLLDFGIARLHPTEADKRVEVATGPGTKVGVLLGTVEYMSPEQLRSGPVDHRSDLFSLGVMLYEMTHGRRPFAGTSVIDLAAAVLTNDPQMGAHLAAADPALDQVIRRCLRKEPDERFASAGEIAALLGGPTPTVVSASPAASPARRAIEGSVAVLPFVDLSAEHSLEYFCDGIAEEILNELARVPGLRVAARSSSFQFKGRTDDVREVSRALNVRAVLEGSVRSSGRHLRISPRLVDAEQGFQVWAERFDRELDDIFAVQDEIARAVVRGLQLGSSATALTMRLGAGTSSVDAYTRYLKGRHHWNRRTEADLETSVTYFEEALALDPDYAEAHAALAESFVTLGLYGARNPASLMPRARESAAQALERSPLLADAQATMACVDAVYGWDWVAAEKNFKRAIATNPNASRARHWLAINCLAPLGRFDEARGQLALALEVDPLSPAVAVTVGLLLYLARRHDEAIAELDRSMALHPDFAIGYLFLGFAHVAAGRHEEARHALETAHQLSHGSPEVISGLGYAAGRRGDAAAAKAHLDALVTRSAERYTSPTLMAQVLAGLGEHDDALTWLERARDVRAADLTWLAVRPVWDPLRSTPRFKALLGTLRLAGAG